MNWNTKDLKYWFIAMGELLLIFIIVNAGSVPVILLFKYADSLGIFWILLLIVYEVILLRILAQILYRREMARLKRELGEEAFYELMPAEKRRDERIAAKKAKKAKKLAEKREKERRRAYDPER